MSWTSRTGPATDGITTWVIAWRRADRSGATEAPGSSYYAPSSKPVAKRVTIGNRNRAALGNRRQRVSLLCIARARHWKGLRLEMERP